MEAGGNAPFIIFDDANVEEAVNGASYCQTYDHFLTLPIRYHGIQIPR